MAGLHGSLSFFCAWAKCIIIICTAIPMSPKHAELEGLIHSPTVLLYCTKSHLPNAPPPFLLHTLLRSPAPYLCAKLHVWTCLAYMEHLLQGPQRAVGRPALQDRTVLKVREVAKRCLDTRAHTLATDADIGCEYLCCTSNRARSR
jgi:hypothetical protein